MSQTSKVALITGASRGIGACTARRLAARGISVFLAGLDTDAQFESVVESCRSSSTGNACFAWGRYDLTEQNAAERMVEDAAARLGRIDYLVNNAGIRIRQSFGQFSYDDFHKIIAVNLRGPFFASQAVLPHMRRIGGGRIVNVASQMAQIAEKGLAIYGMTKAALVHLTKSMACELVADNILVNAISPGPTMTEYNIARTSNDPELLAFKLSKLPANHYASPDEIAEVIEFLLTTKASSLIGHDLVVDGGYTIQ